MRLIPARAVNPQPMLVKKTGSQVQRLDAPIKGLSMVGKTSVGDPQTATILTNWLVREDHIIVRPGTKLIRDHYAPLPDNDPGRHAIAQLMPYLAEPQHILAATNHRVVGATSGTDSGIAFTSDEWHWTMFANLGQAKFLVMVNGQDGVWSYDGQANAAPAVVNVTATSGTNPVQLTVASTDIGKFVNGRSVTITGATGPRSAMNGMHGITAVGTPPNTFSLVGVDMTGQTSQTSGIQAQTYGSLMKEDVRPGPGMPFCDVNSFQIVLAHINRLYFADKANLAVYYLPLQSKGGPVTPDPADDPGLLKVLPMNAIFKRGGYIKALASWTLDGGDGMDDKLCVFTSNGEVAIYTGIDPADTGFGLIGVYRFDSPMNRYCCSNYGGDLWVLTSTGLAPLSVLMRAEAEKLNKAEKGVISLFRNVSARYKNLPGWYLILDSTSGFMACNMPMGAAGLYKQMVRFMPDPIWADFKDLPSRCLTWMEDRLYFGTDDGKFYDLHRDYRSDAGRAITAEFRGAWQNYKTPGKKHFKLVRVYAQSDGTVTRPSIDMAVDYIERRPLNIPDPIVRAPATPWGAPWGSPWSPGKRSFVQWGGVARLGNVGAPHVKVSVLEASYQIDGFDVVYEGGAIV